MSAQLGDRLGAKRVLFCALAWVTLGNLALAFAGAYWQLLACKIFTGIGTGVCFVGGARYVHAAAKGPRCACRRTRPRWPRME